MTRPEFDNFLLVFAGLAFLLALLNFALIKKQGPKGLRLGIAAVAAGGAVLVYRATIMPLAIFFGVVSFCTMTWDMLVRGGQQRGPK